jgi:SAM-dependent methyltransferase
MSLYDTPEGVDRYLERTEGHDGSEHVERLFALLPEGAQVLELGTGPGKDFELMRHRFSVLATDTSFEFLERLQDRRPGADLLEMDARTLKTERTFDGIYSNKVLHHLTPDELAESFRRQADRLLPGGVALHTVWHGEGPAEQRDGLLVCYHTEDTLTSLLPEGLSIETVRRYSAQAEGDSLEVVLRKPRGRLGFRTQTRILSG